jgi:O-antigen/teichoic acid export membrane protein
MAVPGAPAPASTLSRNIGVALAAQSLTLLLLLVVGRSLFRTLGGEAFGLINFSSTVCTALAGVLDLGTTSTVVREVAANRGHDSEYVDRVLRSASAVCWATYALAAMAMAWSSPLLVSGWLHLDTLEPSRAAHVLAVLTVSGLLALPRGVYAASLRGIDRLDLASRIDAAAVTVQQAGALGLALTGAGIGGVAIWLATVHLGWNAAYALAVRRHFGGRVLRLAIDPAAVRRNLPFSRSMLGISALATVHSHADRVILSGLLPVTRFGYYAFGYSLVSRGAVLASAVSQAALPALSAQFAREDRSGLLARYHRLQAFVCYGAAVLFAAVPFAVVPVFSLVFGRAAAWELLAPLSLVALGFFLNSTLTVPYMLSLAAGQPAITVRLNLHALWVTLPATAGLVVRFGLLGAGLSWVFYHLFAYTYGFPRICRACLGLSPLAGARPTLGALGLALASYGPAWAAARAAGAGTLAMSAAFAAGTLLFLLGAVRLTGMDTRAWRARLGLVGFLDGA